MAQMTSAEAAKLLKKLNDELYTVTYNEEQSKEFLAALGEDPETVRPEYDYSETSAKIDALEEKIRVLKHTISVFNTTTVVPQINMTIDQALVYIPQLTKRCAKLLSMMTRLPKTRENASGYGRNNAIIDYRYINYDAKTAESDYYRYKAELDKAQLQLDHVNSTVYFTVDDSVLN